MKVPFSYANRPVQQRRPALVVAIPGVTRGPELVWVLMVTRAANRGWPGDVAISDLEAAGLPAPSVIRSAKIATIEAGDVEGIGQLAGNGRRLVMAALRRSFGHVLTG